MNGEMKCMPVNMSENMPVDRMATIVELQLEGLALVRRITEMVNILSESMYGIALPDGKMDDPRNLRDALVQENSMLNNLCKELDRMASDFGCR